MSLAFDEYGRPFIVLKEQEKKKRETGLAAQKSNILAARTIANTVRSSLGPKGMDKILVDQDKEITITNDGATILDKMDIDHEIGKLFVQLSKSQDEEIGDGTTSVVILASAMLDQAEELLEKGIHPIQISKGFDKACEIAISHLNTISDEIKVTKENKEFLIKTAKTTLSSKVISRHLDKMAKIAVEAVLAVADFERNDVNFDMIKIEGKVGGKLEETFMVNGVILDKELSHSQMKKEFKDAKIALLTCAFEPPKPKTKNIVEIDSVDAYNALYDQEQNYFKEMVKLCKDSGADIVMCQWGFDDEANHLLLQNEMPAIRWVGGVEMELIAIATGARIVPRFEELNQEKLGVAGTIKEITFGTTKDKMLIIEKCKNAKTATIFIRAGNKMAVEEAKRSLNDAICVTRNLIRSNSICYGGGSAEISCSLKIEEEIDNIKGLTKYSAIAFASALESIPLALAENSGLSPIKAVSDIKKSQKSTKNPYLDVNVMQKKTNDMKEQSIFETLLVKFNKFN